VRTETVLVVTCLVLCFALVSGLVKQWYVAPALIFTGLGLVLGPFGFGVVDVRADREDFKILAELALTVILFHQASELDLRSLFRSQHAPLRLLVVGIPLTIALGTVTAVLLLPVLPFWEAVCLAAIVAPTEAALIDALLEDPRIPERVRDALSVESGLYDGVALAVLLAAVALASEHADPSGGHWAWFAFRMELVSLAVGIAIGVIGGRVVVFSRSRRWMSHTWAQLVTLALALVCYAVGEQVGGSGFVAAFAGGLAYALASARGKDDEEEMAEVSDAAGQVLELVVFAIFGAVAVVPAWRDAGWRVILFAVLTLVVVRVVAVAVALVGSGMTTRSTLFIGWFGPRGIGTLVLALVVLEEGDVTRGAVIVQAAIVVVTLSLVLHSLTVLPGIRLLGPTDRTPATRAPTESEA
jgi:sodium/hydrogen antiporter